MSPRQEAMLLHRACGMDYRTYCSAVPFGGGRVIECLRENGPSLSRQCRSALISARRDARGDRGGLSPAPDRSSIGFAAGECA
jgi:hypothetical protein